MNATLGYARVSTAGQELDAQLAALGAAGVDAGRAFTDKLSGSAKTARPGLAAMLDYARAGDTVVVPLTGSATRSPKSPAPSQNLVIAESSCAPCAKELTPPPPPVAAWPPSWPPSPNSSLSWLANAGQRHANPGAHGSCRPPSRPSSQQTGKNSFAGSPPLASLYMNSPKLLVSGGQPGTATSAGVLQHRNRLCL